MNECLHSGAIHVHDMRLWAHVGVLDSERQNGQWFSLDFTLWLDLEKSSKEDDLSDSVDYSLAIKGIQQLAVDLECLTIEHFSEKILDLLETLYGSLKMRVILRKVHAPVTGFTGTVAVERCRY